MGKRKLLFLAHRIPYPPNKGDKIRSYNFVKRLALKFDVLIGTFIDDPDDWSDVTGLESISIEYKVENLSPKVKKIISLLGFITNEALTLGYFRSKALSRWVDKMLVEHKPDIAFIYSSSMAQYVINSPHAPKKIIIDLVDVDSEKWRLYAAHEKGLFKWLYNRESKKLLAYEKKCTSLSKHTILVSEKEAELYRSLAPEYVKKIHGIANGIDADFFDPQLDYLAVGPNNAPIVTMTGAMDYKPNIDAAHWFAQEILPIIQKKIPTTQFYIVGSAPAGSIVKLAKNEAITVTGRVEDVRPYIASAKCIVAPIRIARGIQNKVLEGMAMGKTVIATPQAFEGIDAIAGTEIIIAESAVDFANSVIAALSPDASTEIGEKARKRVIQHYSWDSKFSQLLELLN